MPFDLYGDPLPKNALLRLGTVRLRHARGVVALAFSPQAELLASVGSDQTAALWDPSTGRCLQRIWLADRASCLAFSPDGLTLAAGGRKFDQKGSRSYGFIATIRMSDGQLLRELDFQQESSDVEGVVFSPDGRVLATAGFDATVRLFDAIRLREIEQRGFTGEHWCTDLDFSPDGKMIAVAQGPLGSGRIVLLESSNLNEITPAFSLPTSDASHAPNVPRCVSFNGDGALLASGGDDRRLSVWEVESRHRILCLSGHRPEHWGAIASVEYSSDGKLLITGGYNEAIVREAAGGREIERFPHHGTVHGLSISKDNSLLAVSSGNIGCPSINIISLAAHKKLHDFDAHEGCIRGLAFLSRSNLLISMAEDHTIRIWNLDSAQTTSVLHDIAVTPFKPVVSPDGRYLGAYLSTRILRIWSLTNDAAPKEACSIPALGHFCFTADSRYVIALTSGGEGPVVWETATGKESRRFEGKFGASLLSTSSVQNHVMVASGQEMHLLNLETSQTISSWAPGGFVHDVNFMPMSHTLCMLVLDKHEKPLLRFCNPESGQITKPDILGVRVCGCSPDGKLLLTSDGTSKVLAWDTHACSVVKEFDTGSGFVSAVTFDGNGMRFATGGADSTIHVWSSTMLKRGLG